MAPDAILELRSNGPDDGLSLDPIAIDERPDEIGWKGLLFLAYRVQGVSADVLKIFSGLEADRSPWRYPHFLARPWVASDAALSGLHLENAEPAQFDPFAALHGDSHGVEDGIDSDLGLDFRDLGNFRDFVDNVDLDHA